MNKIDEERLKELTPSFRKFLQSFIIFLKQVIRSLFMLKGENRIPSRKRKKGGRVGRSAALSPKKKRSRTRQ
jgi:hypothetical protein